MSWIGAGIGALLGAQRGGLLGSVIGAVVGNWVEDKIKGMKNGSSADVRSRQAGASYGGRGANSGELATLAAIAAILSKLAKADGRITADEVRYCETVFDRLGLHGEKREYCIRVFQTAKSDGHSIYEYAESFASSQSSASVREVVYGILWDLACIDGEVSPEERSILKQILPYLRLNPALFGWECRQRGLDGGEAGSQARSDPYEVLGCSRNASDEEVKRAYREKAKQLHPDALRAQGLSDELISRANEQMARINAAWSEIKLARKL